MAGGLVDVDEVSEGEFGDAIVFTPLDSEPGLRIVDQIERREYSLAMPTAVAPEPVDAGRFPAPVDAAVRVRTTSLSFPKRESVYVMDEEREPVVHAYDSAQSCPAGRYLVEITTPVKLYLHVEGSIRISPNQTETTIEFEAPTDVVVAARSVHQRPSGTVTTTDDLDDLRAAVSTLGSALKTTSPERSYPTLRGHPPRIQLGEEWARPAHLEPPESGVTLEVDRSLEDLIVAAPLAFYLGADVTWGDRRLVTDDGFVHSLTGGFDFETGVERALKQTFLLDCLTRTEGYYRVDLDERCTFESRTDGRLDFGELYDTPLIERLERYLEVPYRTVADLVPTWGLTAYVQPDPAAVTYLPYLLDVLSVIRTTSPDRLEHYQHDRGASMAVDWNMRSAEPVSPSSPADSHLVLPETEDAMTRVWVGNGVPIGSSKALAAGFEHRLEREPRTEDIRIQVVCNEPEMRDERDEVEAVYTARPDYPLDVTVRSALSTDELRDALGRPTDLFHFIGHVDEKGFRCHDGWLDADDCGSVGADVFLLNSCRSYEQGEALVRQGSIAGIVTVMDLLNHHAAAIGTTLGRFLNHGFPLYAALDVIRESHRYGHAYTLLGDPHAVLFQPLTTLPELVELRSRSGESRTVTHQTFPTHRVGIGTDICPSHEEGDRHYLFGGEIATVELPVSELESLLALPMPLREKDDLRFSLSGSDPD